MNAHLEDQVVAIRLSDLRAVVRETVGQVLEEWFEDPDAGLELREEVAARLRSTLAREEAGAWDFVPAEEAAKRLGVEW